MAGRVADYNNIFISGDIKKDIAIFKEIFKNDVTVRVKNISARKLVPFDAALIYIDGMVDSTQVNEAIIEPLIEMEDQAFGPTSEAFGTLYGDGLIRMYQPTAYTSYFSSCEKFIFQYMTLYVPGMEEGYNTVGTFVNAVEWISDAEAEKLKREGY